MLKRTLLVLFLVPAAALAQPRPGRPPEPFRPGEPPRALSGEERAEMRDRVIRRIKTMRAVDIAEILALDDAAAVQLSRRLSDFDTKRVELMMTMHERTKDLRAAAQGDTKVVAINAAQQLFVAQVELANLAKREFDELSKGVPPDRLARLAVYLHEFDRRIGKMARQIRERGRMMGPPGAPMGGTPPPDWDDE